MPALRLAPKASSRHRHGYEPIQRRGQRHRSGIRLHQQRHQGNAAEFTPEQQEMLMAAEPAAFKPAAGAWGRRGSTHVRLAAINATTLRSALTMVWRNVAEDSHG